MLLNILSNDASTVGSYDLTIFSSNNGRNILLEKLKENSIDLLFLIGQDKINIERKGVFVVYIGSHVQALPVETIKLSAV